MRVGAGVSEHAAHHYGLPATTLEAIGHVAKHMADIGVRHMPVLAEGEIVGMVSARDALQVFSDTLDGSEAAR